MRVKRLKPINKRLCPSCRMFYTFYTGGPELCADCDYETRKYVPPEDEDYKYADNRDMSGFIGRTKIGIAGVDK